MAVRRNEGTKELVVRALCSLEDSPRGAVPVVIKSLVFPGSEDLGGSGRRSVQAPALPPRRLSAGSLACTFLVHCTIERRCAAGNGQLDALNGSPLLA